MGVNLENDWTEWDQKIKYEKKILLISESLMGGTGSRLCQEMKKSARLCATSQLKAGQICTDFLDGFSGQNQ